MKKQLRLIVISVIILLVVCLPLWRFWPYSLANLVSIDEDSITNFSAYTMVSRFENGQSYLDNYRIDSTEQEAYHLAELIKILNISGYRQDFRNLLPWGLDSVSADKNYDGQTVILAFYTGNEKDEYVQIQFMSSSIIAVQEGDKPGFRIYHPTSPKTIARLVDYLQNYGVKQYIS